MATSNHKLDRHLDELHSVHQNYMQFIRTTCSSSELHAVHMQSKIWQDKFHVACREREAITDISEGA